jgi:hypothetical protein
LLLRRLAKIKYYENHELINHTPPFWIGIFKATSDLSCLKKRATNLGREDKEKLLSYPPSPYKFPPLPLSSLPPPNNS